MKLKTDDDGLEDELVRRAQLGELQAFNRLVERYRSGCIWQARQILSTRELAEDAVQESFLSAYKALPNLSEVHNFPAWLGAVVRNASLRLLRGTPKNWTPIDSVILAHTPSLQAEFDVKSEAKEICCAMNLLIDDLKLPMELYYLEDWSVSRIARFTGIPATTVKWRLHTGRRLLRARLPHLMENQ
jgi:RNA polymerase sigma-70 factor (ECF subfamily)